MNVKIEYLYRDADNYKSGETVVCEGPATADELDEFRAAIARASSKDGFESDSFSPHELDLPPAQYGLWGEVGQSDADHIMNELVELTLTDEAPTPEAPAWVFVLEDAKEAAERGWDVVGAVAALGV